VLRGEAGNDTLVAGDGLQAFVVGGNGADSLQGGNNDSQSLFGEGDVGESGNDTLVAGGGNNQTLYGRNDADSLLGGTGTSQFLYGEVGNDTLVAGEGINQFLSGGNDNDSLLGGTKNDSLDGGNGNDTLDGFGGDDTLIGGNGSDSLIGGAGTDLASYANAGGSVFVDLTAGTQSGADGSDNLTGIENVLGGNSADNILGDTKANMLDGGNGSDTLDGFGGDDTLIGGNGSDSLIGGAGTDLASYVNAGGSVTVNLDAGTQSGADGSDKLTGIENVLGGNSDDSILGDTRSNVLDGGNGNDTLSGGAGDDTLVGGADNDFASYANATDPISAFLGNGTNPGVADNPDGSADQLFGIEGLIGGDSNDTLAGNSAVNTLMGGDGSDSLFGGGGNDLLDYGAGDDEFQWIENITTGDLTLIGGDGGNDFLNLGEDWVNGPVTGTGWINYTKGNQTLYTQGWESIVCFAEGTRIVTPSGEDAVENLRAGDMVLAMRDGQAGFEPLRWVGFMDVAVPRNAAMAAKTAPVLIKAGALAAGMPARDLRVSPDHAMEVDGHLIPAKHLVNGSSIIQEVWCKRVRYFHLELEAHGLLLSEGTWSESYLDDGNRHAFNNAAMTGLFLDFEAGRSKGQYDHQACLPVLRQGLKLDEIHGRLALRAEELARGAKVLRHG
jgi:Ca2+-binding RTX toxin-like protein